MSTYSLEEILHPQSIAVVGASDNPNASGYNFTTHLLEYGFKGKIYPVNPKYPEILGMKAYPSLRDIPGSVDYVISCVPAPEVLNMLEDCSQKGVKAVHFFTGRFSGVFASLAQTAWDSIIPRKESLSTTTSPGSQGQWDWHLSLVEQQQASFV